MAPISNAKSISIGPRVVPVAPKKTIMPSSATTKMAHATISGRGCCKYLFIRLSLLSFGRIEVFVLSSIHHNLCCCSIWFSFSQKQQCPPHKVGIVSRQRICFLAQEKILLEAISIIGVNVVLQLRQQIGSVR